MKALFLLSGLIISLLFFSDYAYSQQINRDKPVVGAIRWDAWCGKLNPVGLAVERDLSPNQYHYRAPFYSKIISPDSINIRCTTIGVMDKEIAYAKYAGIDYWAFCWYQNGCGLDIARKLYLSSKHKNDVKWCLILGTAPFDDDKDGPWLIQEFKKINYQKVLGGRPILYLYGKSINLLELKKLRLLNKNAGNKEIYVVLMNEDTKKCALQADSLQADAISAYTTWTFNNGGNYAPLVPQTEISHWNAHMATGKQVVPWITTGKNTKPRINRPVFWTKVKPTEWTKDASAADIANHLQDALTWMKKNPTATLSNTILIYAWNEFDEGGWICPTIGNNTSRLDAIKGVLKGRHIIHSK